ncbi:hemicentin-2-like isoform X3 [Bolinopsis microptera]|uniref:hemicentin-2-like isoform X3 n=1 Tax=Bolinopsis microptera TaxID=2820187 RepID=UPI00307A4B1B
MTAFRYVVLIETLIVLSLSESGPFFSLEPSPVEVNRTGGQVQFTCSARGYPAPVIVWYKDSQRLIPKGHISDAAVDGLYNHRILTITGVRHNTDAGEYSCEAENKMGVIRSRKATLTAPYFLKDQDYFTKNPLPTYTASPGQGTIIHCEFDPAASWPQAQIFWRKYSTQLIEDERFDNIWPTESRFISQLKGTMVIAQTKSEDSGTYRCGARNAIMGTISESDKARLVVESGRIEEVPADIYVPLDNIAVVSRSTAILECIPYGTPTPTIRWSKDGGELPDRSIVSDNTVLLTIPNFGSDAEGRYYCTAIQNNDKVRVSLIDLTLLQPPEFPLPSRNLTVMEGGDLNVPCDCLGIPEPEVTWFKNTEPINNNINEDKSLTLFDVKAISSGMYQCHCTNEIGNAQATFAVQVKGPAKIVSEAVDKSVGRGTEVTLTCEAQGSPTPSIVWLKDSRALPSDSRIRHHENLYESTIYISDVRITDNGVYECKAINENGDDSIFIKISVYGPPYINVKPKDTVGITGSDILVPCEATAEPVPVITWYRNERALTSADVDKYEFTEQGLKIKDAQAVDGGSFMCQASNSENMVSSKPVQVTVYNVPTITHALPTKTNVTAGQKNLLLHCDNGTITTIKIFPTDDLVTSIITTTDDSAGDGNSNTDTLTIVTESESERETKPPEPTSTDVYTDTETETPPTTDITEPLTTAPTTDAAPRVGRANVRTTDTVQEEVVSHTTSSPTASVTEGGGFADLRKVEIIEEDVVSEDHPGSTEIIGEDAITKDFATYQWYRRGIPLLKVYYEGGNTPRIETRKGNGLFFKTVLPEDQGEYSCNVSNPAAKSSVSGYLYVDVMPIITYISPNDEVREYESFWLDCLYEGEPTPTLQWKHNNAPLRRDHVIFPNGTLKITSATRFDSGAYQCTVTNRQGSRSKDVIITVRSKARIENIPSLQYPITGERSTLICEVSGYPFPTVEWWKNGVRLQTNTYNQNGFSKVGSNLIIQDPESTQHDGLYTCKASNDFGSDSSVTQVRVYDLPSVTRVSGCDSVTADMECSIVCEARGKPLPVLTWRFKEGNETVIAQSTNERYYVRSMDSDSSVPYRELTLTFKKVQGSDSKTYFCHAENPAGKTSTAHQVKVRYQAVIESPPLPTYEVPIGATLTITCKARGEPLPQIKWTGPKGTLPPNGRATIDENSSLILMNIQNDDEGEYTCTADNNKVANDFDFDVVSSSTTVKVTSKGTPLTVIDNPIETWLIVVIVICVFVVCIVVFVSVKMIRDKSRERRSYKPTQNTLKSSAEEANYQFETVTPKPVMFQVPIDTSNSLPMYNLRTLNWADKHPPNNFQSQFDDVDRQLQGLLKDLDNPKLDNLESDI